jgi:exodeoxyribonuclease VII large subunit
MLDLPITPSEFIAILNQSLEYAFPSVVIEGELSEFRVSKNRWLYFSLVDEEGAVLKFFATVYMLPGPLEDGMKVLVRCSPKHHQAYGFSMQAQSIQVAGLGSLKRASDLLLAKLTEEGLFAPERKRALPDYPEKLAVITSSGSAAEADFLKIAAARWPLAEITLANVHVQGELAPSEIVKAVEFFNNHGESYDALVLIRGGGSVEDLAAFSTESVVRAVAGSRIPTVVAIGHEVDLSLAEMASDLHASTPSNAAELLLPDYASEKQNLVSAKMNLNHLLEAPVVNAENSLSQAKSSLEQDMMLLLSDASSDIISLKNLLEAYNPVRVLKNGYAVARLATGKLLRSKKDVKTGDEVELTLSDGMINMKVT